MDKRTIEARGRKEAVGTENRFFLAVLGATGLLFLAACGGGGGAATGSARPDAAPTDQSETRTVPTIQLRRPGDPVVTVTWSDDTSLYDINIGDVSTSDGAAVASLSSGNPRQSYARFYRAGNLEMAWVSGVKERGTGTVLPLSYLRYGAWATVTTEPGGDPLRDYRFADAGNGYLVDFPDSRTRSGDMPRSGRATYHGGYIGYVQRSGEPAREANGSVDMTADFATATMTVEMQNSGRPRATIVGSMRGSLFAGTTLRYLRPHTGFQAEGATANMRGAFYGPQAAESGGVFEIVEGRAQNPGRFVGSFGGKRDDR